MNELHRRRDLLSNLTIKNCDEVEEFKKFTNILVQKFKKATTFQRSLNVIIKSTMSEKRTNINVKEFLCDVNKSENM